jgi:hypothetical protein
MAEDLDRCWPRADGKPVWVVPTPGCNCLICTTATALREHLRDVFSEAADRYMRRGVDEIIATLKKPQL